MSEWSGCNASYCKMSASLLSKHRSSSSPIGANSASGDSSSSLTVGSGEETAGCGAGATRPQDVSQWPSNRIVTQNSPGVASCSSFGVTSRASVASLTRPSVAGCVAYVVAGVCGRSALYTQPWSVSGHRPSHRALRTQDEQLGFSPSHLTRRALHDRHASPGNSALISSLLPCKKSAGLFAPFCSGPVEACATNAFDVSLADLTATRRGWMKAD